ncbi:MAG TPA: murein biosynthesis integral membrane protein MurJ [Methylomirabilota bacterium]|nr:murein biosynthesis integral membrane protein MurJ [Methylomirabilota bacterium]
MSADDPIGTDTVEVPPSPPVTGARGTVARAAAVVSSATLVSRILGFLRDLLIARAFGAGEATDAFFVAFRLPNLLRRLVAEGAVSSAFIPVLTEYVTTRPRADTLRMLRAVTGVMVLLLGSLTVLGILAAPWVVRIMAPGFFTNPAVGELTVRLARLMFPYLFFVGLAAVAMGILNAHRHFLLPALSPVALNVGMIVGVLVLAPRLPEPVIGVALGVLLGGAGQLLLQLPWLGGRGLLALPRIELRHPAVRRILSLVTPVIVGQSANHMGMVINTIIASFLAKGSVSYLYYADRLVEFPLGVFGVAIATAVLPTLSEQAARRDKQALRETLSFSLRLATFISMPAAVGLFVLSEPIVRVLYERGRFGPAETAGTAAAVAMYALGIVGSTTAKISAQAFFALGDTRTPVKVAVCATAFNCAVSAALAGPLGHVGLALAIAGASTANAIALTILLRRRLPGRPTPGARRAWLRTVGVSAGLALLIGAVWRFAPPPPGRLAEGTWLAVVIVGSTAAYVGCHAALGAEEVRLAWSALTRRARRSSLRRKETR